MQTRWFQSPWYEDVYTYLHNNTLSPDLSSTQKRASIHYASCFIILGDALFERILDGILLKCLDLEEAKIAYMMYIVICGDHSSGLIHVKNLL